MKGPESERISKFVGQRGLIKGRKSIKTVRKNTPTDFFPFAINLSQMFVVPWRLPVLWISRVVLLTVVFREDTVTVEDNESGYSVGSGSFVLRDFTRRAK